MNNPPWSDPAAHAATRDQEKARRTQLADMGKRCGNKACHCHTRDDNAGSTDLDAEDFN